MKNPDVAIAFAATVEAIEDKAMIEGALKAAMKTIGTSGNCPELKSFAESLYKEKPPNPMGNGG